MPNSANAEDQRGLHGDSATFVEDQFAFLDVEGCQFLTVPVKAVLPVDGSATTAETKRTPRRVLATTSHRSARSGDSADRPTTAKDQPGILMADGNIFSIEYQRDEGLRESVPPKTSTGLYYHSHAEARRSIGTPTWMPPMPDDAIPMTDQAKGVWVLALRTAMEDMSDYADGQGPKMQTRWFSDDWVPGDVPKVGDVLTNPYYPAHWMEEKCWEIVVSYSIPISDPYYQTNTKQELCVRLHRFGPSVISCRDPFVLKRSFLAKDLTFEGRMSIIVQVASKCKSRVGHMISGGVIEEYLLNSDHLLYQTAMNRRNNAKKQTYINTGRPSKNVKQRSSK
jgi:hypothetical protein